MRIGRARRRARRAVHAYARRLGVPPPLVQFTHAPRPGFSAYTYEGKTRHVVVFSHEALLQPAWAVRSVATHEMGHVKERHYLRVRRAALMLALTGIALAWCAPIPWGLSLAASIAVGRMALRVADVGTYIQHEIEADRWAARLGAMAVRRRELFGKHERPEHEIVGATGRMRDMFLPRALHALLRRAEHGEPLRMIGDGSLVRLTIATPDEWKDPLP